MIWIDRDYPHNSMIVSDTAEVTFRKEGSLQLTPDEALQVGAILFRYALDHMVVADFEDDEVLDIDDD